MHAERWKCAIGGRRLRRAGRQPEYDLGIIVREDPVELVRGDPRDRSRRLAAMTGLDETAIWKWGVVERVSTGLLAARIGMQPVGGKMLRAADFIAARA